MGIKSIKVAAIFVFILAGSANAQHSINIYANAGADMITAVSKKALPRVYVPNSGDDSVSLIDPATYRVVATLHTGKEPEHIVPAYDLKTIWVLNYKSNTITAIDPNTATPKNTYAVNNPYNMYFTADGRFAIIVNDIDKRLDFRNPQDMSLYKSIPVTCNGVNHMDFTADGKFAVASCEMSGELLILDVAQQKIKGTVHLARSARPQDVRLSPNGQVFYVADMVMDGVFLIDATSFRAIGFIKTGIGAHSIYPSRNGQFIYVSNRGCNKMYNCPAKGAGSIAVIDPMSQKVVNTWKIAGGGSPDMGNISADGNELWLSGKYDRVVYVFNTKLGKLTHRIPVGNLPHGLTIWPQAGRYSLGHTGNMR